VRRIVALGALFAASVGTVSAQSPPERLPEFDTSGKGAVLCTWSIMVEMRNGIDLCFPGEYPSMRRQLSEGIDATNDFIVANSPAPTTKAQLEAAIVDRAKKERDRLAGQPGPIAETQHCQTLRKDWLAKSQSDEEFKRWLADFLSVPRKPLMNPCL
jgi:hypothetical protein